LILKNALFQITAKPKLPLAKPRFQKDRKNTAKGSFSFPAIAAVDGENP